MNPPTDNQIVRSVLRGDRNAFEQIVRRYHAPLRRLAINRVGRMDLADDIVQETFLSAYRSLHTYKSAYNFRTWLWTILINQCRRQGARSARQPTQLVASCSSEAAQPLVSEVPAPNTRIEFKEQSGYLQSLLQQLPDNHADAVRLRFFGELKYREIADALACSLSAAKKWVRAGLLEMSELMQQANSPYLPAVKEPTCKTSCSEANTATKSNTQTSENPT